MGWGVLLSIFQFRGRGPGPQKSDYNKFAGGAGASGSPPDSALRSWVECSCHLTPAPKEAQQSLLNTDPRTGTLSRDP